ncbi:MAG: Lrp/AsnC family transcriptional regulator [Candidatus Heimdallarchaeota archaeon]
MTKKINYLLVLDLFFIKIETQASYVKFVINSSKFVINQPKKKNEKMLDKIDKKIIEILMDDSRITNVQIAKKIKRSESTVRQRLIKLTENGIIKKFTIEVNPNAFGYNTIAYVGITAHPGKLLKVIKSLKKINDVVSIATSTGDYMIICKIWADDGVHLSDIVDKIEDIDGVIEVLPSIIQEKHKEK